MAIGISIWTSDSKYTLHFLDWLAQIVDFYGIALKKQTTEKVLI